ncbi:AraC family transcriptional regulator [uncultured Croceicoccus sp.]|uniref:AraC family transcriptional regulator n=1 Tax=uncultured Croceicoccus sp. TaxID=1295329 RepID=UPI00260CE582|nr:AraC family transcriptional regulator [uncultured Croceicoccus sp.]
MRICSTLGYAERIERAIALLERKAAAGEPASLSDLASAAALSPYHFHRIFRVMTGESVGDAIVRARLGGALPMLDRSIFDAVTQSGYATSQAFARAVKVRTDATPSELRNDPIRRKQAEESLALPEQSGAASPPITIKITSVAPLRLAAIRNVGDYAELNHGFGQLVEQIVGKAGPEGITGLYGIPYGDPRDVEPQYCRFDCAVSTSVSIDPDDQISIIDCDGGPALEMTHCGDYDRIHDAVDALYRRAVREELQLSGAPLLIHYAQDPEEVPTDELFANVYLWLEPAVESKPLSVS